MRYLIVILFFLAPLLSFSQNLPEVEALNRVILNHKDSIIYAHLLPSDLSKKISASDKYWYNWYAQHDIKETKGGFDGKLLHGNYTEYYANKDLKRKGVFRKGLKKGKWKSWHQNGQLSEILFYKNGLKNGKYRQFNAAGAEVGKGKYKKGVLKIAKTKKPKKVTVPVDGQLKKTKKRTFLFFKKKEKVAKPENGVIENGDTPMPIEQPADAPKEDKELKKDKKLKKEKKAPKVKVRRSIKLVPQPGSST